LGRWLVGKGGTRERKKTQGGCLTNRKHQRTVKGEKWRKPGTYSNPSLHKGIGKDWGLEREGKIVRVRAKSREIKRKKEKNES